MTVVREIPAGETWRAAEAMLELRPRWADTDTLVHVIDNRLRPVGYRLVGAFERGAESAVVDEGRRLGCEAVHLDSGVGSDRAAAHRLYMRHHLRISSHHFQLEL